MFSFYFNLTFGYKLVILSYFFFVHGEIKLTYLLKTDSLFKSCPSYLQASIFQNF